MRKFDCARSQNAATAQVPREAGSYPPITACNLWASWFFPFARNFSTQLKTAFLPAAVRLPEPDFTQAANNLAALTEPISPRAAHAAEATP